MSLHKFVFALAAFLPAAAYSQTVKPFSQPVREVNRDAKTGVFGRCTIRIEPGNSFSNPACTIVNVSGQPVNTLAPGQTLVIEDTTVQLAKVPADTIHAVSLKLGSSPVRYIPLVSYGTANGSNRLAGFVSGRLYTRSADVFAMVLLVLNAQGFVNGDVVFTGHLVDED